MRVNMSSTSYSFADAPNVNEWFSSADLHEDSET